jgi:hypothetical protein
MAKVKQFLLGLCMLWVVVALVAQLTMVTLSFTNPNLATEIAKQITWKIDERFK